MSAPTRRSNPWPLLAMAVLVVLLSVFLYLRWQKRGPAVVKEPPGVPPAVPVADRPPPRDPRREEFDGRMGNAREALKSRDWAEAERHLQHARRLLPEDPRVKEVEDQVAAGRRDDVERAAAEVRQKQDKALAEGCELADRLRKEQKFVAALEALEALAREHPGVRDDPAYSGRLREIRPLAQSAETEYARHMAEAEKHLAEGRFQQALFSSKLAGGVCPERMDKVKQLQDRVNEAGLQRGMIRVAPLVPCPLGSDSQPDEPRREVTLPPFLIDKYEVTNEDYYLFVQAAGRAEPRSRAWFQGRPRPELQRNPVVGVTFADAEAYAKWAGKRLPTADEWEVAARGPAGWEYPWGDKFTEKENAFNCVSQEYWEANRSFLQADRRFATGTAPVDAADVPNAPSAFGVYGMGGNVWEWTSTMAKRKAGERELEMRVLKGGSFLHKARAIRCANVYPEDPAVAHPDVGFRCVRDVR